MRPESFVAIVIALQFAAFGWRINREIKVGDEERRTWLPLPDVINIIALLTTVVLCVVIPLISGEFGKTSKVVLAITAVLIGFHPINVAAHYCLITGRGRERYLKKRGDYPYATGEEFITIVISLIIAAISGWLVLSV